MVAQVGGCKAQGNNFTLNLWRKCGTHEPAQASEQTAHLTSCATTEEFVNENFGLAFAELTSNNNKPRRGR
jgi:hypothetical protein